MSDLNTTGRLGPGIPRPAAHRGFALSAIARVANEAVWWRESGVEHAAPTSTAHAVIGGMNLPVEIHGFYRVPAEVPAALVVRDHGSWWRSQLTIGVTGRG